MKKLSLIFLSIITFTCFGQNYSVDEYDWEKRDGYGHPVDYGFLYVNQNMDIYEMEKGVKISFCDLKLNKSPYKSEMSIHYHYFFNLKEKTLRIFHHHHLSETYKIKKTKTLYLSEDGIYGHFRIKCKGVDGKLLVDVKIDNVDEMVIIKKSKVFYRNLIYIDKGGYVYYKQRTDD
jgi:hypothetical protein